MVIICSYRSNMELDMPTPTREEVLDAAIANYQRFDYGQALDPHMNPMDNADFRAHFNKFDKAYRYYREKANFPDFLAKSHVDGIDFNYPVTLALVAKGTRMTQMQVAWGHRGNYYSSSDFSADQIGVNPQGPGFNPLSENPNPAVAQEYRQRREDHQSHLTQSEWPDLSVSTRGGAPQDRERHARARRQDFQDLPFDISEERQPTRTTKAMRTYEAQDDMVGLCSRSKEITDTWTDPDNPRDLRGGGVQLFFSNEQNDKAKFIGYGAEDRASPDEAPDLSRRPSYH